nr:MAG TPA: hypothetical protein [Caudoviricetes sp.]
MLLALLSNSPILLLKYMLTPNIPPAVIKA